MKFCFLIIIPIIILISCQNNPKNYGQAKELSKKDTNISTNNFVDFDSIEVRRQRLLDTNYSFLDKLLDTSLNLAYKQGFERPFTLTLDTSLFRFKNMYATISFGHLFSNGRQHLIIKRFMNEYNDYETSLYSDIFLLYNSSFKKVAADTCDGGYGEDYFEDLNHDGYKDYIVQSYSGAGCCPRNLETGYVYTPQNGHFNNMDFFNRETDSLSTNFFETSYGLGNYINLYKYKWQGLRKILLEEIYVTPTKEGAMNPNPTSYTKIFYPSGKKQRIKKLPKEYARLRMAEYISALEN
jgi:hypothetical protein